jgi:hypothetical protein
LPTEEEEEERTALVYVASKMAAIEVYPSAYFRRILSSAPLL